MKLRSALPLLTLAVACAPTELPPPTSGPLSLEVKLTSPREGDAVYSPVGSADAPLPLTVSTSGKEDWPVRTYAMEISAIGRDGALDSTFSGTGRVTVIPGAVVGDPQVTFSAGKAAVTVQVERIYGPTRIWVEDVGTSEAPGSYATGVLETVYVEPMTLAALQASDAEFTCLNPDDRAMDASECNAFAGSFVDLDTRSKSLVVTQTTTDGFFAMDLSRPDGSYNGIFAYTHSAPAGLYVGDVLAGMRGIVAEYNGATQLSFPIQEVYIGAEPPRAPTFATLTSKELCGDKDGVEPYEGSLVSVEGAKVGLMYPSDQQDYEAYGQWPVAFESGTCDVVVGNAAAVPGFDPNVDQGKRLTTFRGSLSAYEDKYGSRYLWIILPAGPEDLVVE